MGMNWSALLWFVAIVASIPLLLWLFKRSHLIGAQGSAGAARTLAVTPLSPSQKLVTVEMGHGEQRVWLLLGVTPHQISTLHTMSAPPAGTEPGLPATIPSGLDAAAGAAAAPQTAAGSFAQLLGRLRGQSSHGQPP
jgi:flagellar protein FliO/FliZ